MAKDGMMVAAGLLLVAFLPGAAPAADPVQDAPPPPAPSIARKAPVVASMRTPMQTMSAMPVRPVKLVFQLGTTILWSGTLNVGGTMPARVSISEPVETASDCTDMPAYGRAARQVELTISRNRMFGGEDGYMLNARYSRPPEDDCGGSRSIGIEQRFGWDGSGTKRFDGDGGLRVTLSRP